MDKRMIFKIGGLVLCVLFFTLPLVQCSQDSSLNATGYEIATGTGDLFDAPNDGHPFAVLLFVIPLFLTIIAFADFSFIALRNLCIAGFTTKVIFIVMVYNELNSANYMDAFVLTPYNWLIVAMFAGMIGYAQYCNKLENKGSAPHLN